jgi:hypothetical protein
MIGGFKMRVYDAVEISGRKFAILIDDETMTAYEAVWTQNGWETDFCYPAVGIDSFDIAGVLDFEGVQKMGYTFY